MSAPRQVYILFAGVNGAGKSTLYRSNMWQHGQVADNLPRVNSDEILTENGWDSADQAAQMRAGREAVRRIKDHFAHGRSFNQETTLTGRSIIHNIRLAHDKGYRIVMFYVGVESPAIANERIAHRGSVGGHTIDPVLVEKRYRTSLANFTEVVGICDEAYLFDNTALLQLCARFDAGELAFFRANAPQPVWVSSLLEMLGYKEIVLPSVRPGTAR